MRKALRIAGKVLLGLVALLVLAIVFSYPVSALRLRKRYAIAPAAAFQAGPDAVARGRTLSVLYGCTGCHEANLAGQVMIDAFPFARLASANLTRGRGGVGRTYTHADWERAVRHGVRRGGGHLFIMPSDYYNQIRDEELGALVAYLETVPPVDNELPVRRLWPAARVLHAFGAPLVPAEKMDHGAPRVVAPPAGATVAYGKFIAEGCRFCHGENLKGVAKGDHPTPDISRTGGAGRWSDVEFIRTMRTGVTPAGRRLNGKLMPWQAVGELRDDELRGIWMYLQTADSLRAADSAKAAR
jgi:mono/diheme cytochrome c family protein